MRGYLGGEAPLNPLVPSPPALVSPFASAAKSRRPGSPTAVAGPEAPFPRLPHAAAPHGLGLERPLPRAASLPPSRPRGLAAPPLPQSVAGAPPWAVLLKEARTRPKRLAEALPTLLALPQALEHLQEGAQSAPLLASLLALLSPHDARGLLRHWQQHSPVQADQRAAAMAWTAAYFPQHMDIWQSAAALRVTLQTTSGARAAGLFASLRQLPREPALAQAVTTALLGCWDYEPLAAAYAAWLPCGPWRDQLPSLRDSLSPTHLRLLASQWPASTHAAWANAGVPLSQAALEAEEALQLQGAAGPAADLVAAYLTDHIVQQATPHARWGRSLAKIVRHADFHDVLRLLDWAGPTATDPASLLLRALSGAPAANVGLGSLVHHVTQQTAPTRELLLQASGWHPCVARLAPLDEVVQWSLWWQQHAPAELPAFHAAVLDSLHVDGMAQRLPERLSASQLARALPWQHADLRTVVPPALQALAPRWYRHFNAWILLRGGALQPDTQAAEPALRHLAALLQDPTPLRPAITALCEIAGVPRRRLALGMPWMEPLLQTADPLALPPLQDFVARGLSPIGEENLLEALAQLPAPLRSFLQGGGNEPPADCAAELRSLPGRAVRAFAGALLAARLCTLLDSPARLREHLTLAEFCLQWAPANSTVILREAFTRLGADVMTLPVAPFPSLPAAQARYRRNLLQRTAPMAPQRQRWLHQLVRALLDQAPLGDLLAVLRWVERHGDPAWAERLGMHLRVDGLRPEQIGTPQPEEVAHLQRILHTQPMAQRLVGPQHPLCTWMPERFWEMRVQAFLNAPHGPHAPGLKPSDRPRETAALTACLEPHGTPIPHAESFPELLLVRQPRQALQQGLPAGLHLPVPLRAYLESEQRRATSGRAAQHQSNCVASVGRLLFFCRLAGVEAADLQRATPMVLRALRDVADVQTRDHLLRRLVSDLLSPHAPPSQRALLQALEAAPTPHPGKLLALACLACDRHVLQHPALLPVLRSGSLHDGRILRRLLDFVLHTPTPQQRDYVRQTLTWGSHAQVQRCIVSLRPVPPPGSNSTPSGAWLAQQEAYTQLRSLHLAHLRQAGHRAAAYEPVLQQDAVELQRACQRLAADPQPRVARLGQALQQQLRASAPAPTLKALRSAVQAALKLDRRNAQLAWCADLLAQLPRHHADMTALAGPGTPPSGHPAPEFFLDGRARTLHSQQVLPMILALEEYACVLAEAPFDPSRCHTPAAVQAAGFPLPGTEAPAAVLADLRRHMRSPNNLLLYAANMRRWEAHAQPERGLQIMHGLVQAICQGPQAVVALRRAGSAQLRHLLAKFEPLCTAWERGFQRSVASPLNAGGAPWTLHDSGDPDAIIAAVTQIESCQSVRKPEHNMGLQSRLIDGSKRMLLLHDAAGVLRARAALRLMRTAEDRPVLALSRIYPSPTLNLNPHLHHGGVAALFARHLQAHGAALGIAAWLTCVDPQIKAVPQPGLVHTHATTLPAAWGLDGEVPDYWDELPRGLLSGPVALNAYAPVFAGSTESTA